MENFGVDKKSDVKNNQAEIKDFPPKLLTKLITEMEAFAKTGNLTSLDKETFLFHDNKNKIKEIITASSAERIINDILPLLETAQENQSSVWHEFLSLRREALVKLGVKAIPILVAKYKEAQAWDNVNLAEKRSRQMALAITDLEAIIAIWEYELQLNNKEDGGQKNCLSAKQIELAKQKFAELMDVEIAESHAAHDAYHSREEAKILPFKKNNT